MTKEFILGKTYLIKDIDEIYVTATITYEDDEKIFYTDRDKLSGRLLKQNILKWKEVTQ